MAYAKIKILDKSNGPKTLSSGFGPSIHIRKTPSYTEPHAEQ